MNQLTKDKLIKLLDTELPQSMTEDQNSAIYSAIDPEITVIKNHVTQEFTVIKKADESILSEAEILVWLRDMYKMPIEHVKSGNGIKSTNFVQDLGCDPRKLPKDLVYDDSKKVEFANAIMQQVHKQMDLLSDQECIEQVKLLEVQYHAAAQYLTKRNIKIKEEARKKQHIEYENNKILKAEKRDSKEAKKSKPKLTKEQSFMETMGWDYKNPDHILKYQAFLKSLENVE